MLNFPTGTTTTTPTSPTSSTTPCQSSARKRYKNVLEIQRDQELETAPMPTSIPKFVKLTFENLEIHRDSKPAENSNFMGGKTEPIVRSVTETTQLDFSVTNFSQNSKDSDWGKMSNFGKTSEQGERRENLDIFGLQLKVCNIVLFMFSKNLDSLCNDQ